MLPVYDYWREPGGAYVVTRLPAGTLEQALRAGRVTAADALHIGAQVASAVAAAHERGVVHGALGPDAVVDDRGVAFLWAFPLSGESGLPAADVAALASLVTVVAGGDGHDTTGMAVAVDTMPAPVRDVLARAKQRPGGVLPQLKADGSFVTTMAPGARPLAELEIALSRIAAVELIDAADEVVATTDGLVKLVQRVLPTPGAGLVLVVDQFEELFILSDPTERDLFLAAVANAVADHHAPVRVVLTLRADFLGSALTHPTAGPLIRERSVMVGPLDDDELQEVVVRPAEVAGVAVEPALATALVADAARSPGSLPMVQFALTEVFAAAVDDPVMTLAAYRRIGGIDGVLGQRAEGVFAALDEEGQRSAHALFQRLVVPTRDGPPTRRRAPRTELERVPDDVIEEFGRARLLRFDREEQSREPTVEVSHEALFEAWPRLITWIEEGEDDLRLLGHLSAAAADWDAGGREESELYRGSRLDSALDFADSHRRELSTTEEAFLDEARRRRTREQASAKRTVRRLRVLTSGLAAGLGLALIAGGLAWTARQREAEARRREATTARSAQVEALAFAAAGEVVEDPERASLLAAHAYSIEPDIESQAALLDVLDVEPRILSIRPTPLDTCSERTGTGEVVLFSAVSLEGEALEVRNLDQKVLRRIPAPPSSTASRAGLTPSGDNVFVRHFDRLEVHDLDMRVVASRTDLLAPDDQRMVDFDPTRPEAAIILHSGEVAIVTVPELRTQRVLDLDLDVDVATCPAGQAAQVGDGELALVRAVAYSEDASLLAVADAGAVRVVDDAGRAVASTAAATHPDGCAYPFVSAGASVFGHLARRSLVVAPLMSPHERAEIELRGVTTPSRRLALDVARGVATTGDPSGVVESTDVKGVAGVEWDVTAVDAADGRVVVLLRDTDAGAGSPNRSVVLVVDATSAELLDRIEPPDRETWTAAVPFGDDGLLLADRAYRPLDGRRRRAGRRRRSSRPRCRPGGRRCRPGGRPVRHRRLERRPARRRHPPQTSSPISQDPRASPSTSRLRTTIDSCREHRREHVRLGRASTADRGSPVAVAAPRVPSDGGRPVSRRPAPGDARGDRPHPAHAGSLVGSRLLPCRPTSDRDRSGCDRSGSRTGPRMPPRSQLRAIPSQGC